MADVAPGDLLDGKYVVERMLGRGGMGVVVAARHVVLKTQVAIKLLLPDPTRNRELVKRFHREARAAVRIQSPHAARVHDVGQLADGTPYMVMELLTGTDLEALLRKRGVISPVEAVGFVLQALEAVQEAHTLGIIHRDLKPANLFLADQPDRLPIVKVLDFGIARDFEEGKDQRLTVTGDVIGSPAYMSPEQMVEARLADARSDIWSLGACLYELLTGALPFNGKTLAELCKSVQRGAPTPPHAVRQAVPEALSNIVLRCLEKDPALRFASADELARALAGWSSSTSFVPPARASFADIATTQGLESSLAVRAAPNRRAMHAGIAGLALAIIAVTATAIFVMRPKPVLPAVVAPALSEPRAPASSAPDTTVPVAAEPAPPQTGAPEPRVVAAAPPAPTAVVRTTRSAQRSSSQTASPPPPPRSSAPAFDPGKEF